METDKKDVKRSPLGEIMIKQGLLTEEQLATALQKQNTHKTKERKKG